MGTTWSKSKQTDVNASELELELCGVLQGDCLIGAVATDKTVQLEACSAFVWHTAGIYVRTRTTVTMLHSALSGPVNL